MKKIIVTGADGFVGRHLVNLLKENPDNEVISLDRNQADITDLVSLNKFIRSHQPDQVYHLAGFASGAGKDKDLIFKVNIDGTLNILKALQALEKPVKILLASTAYVYGNTPTCADEKITANAKSFYDQSKIKMEEEAAKYQGEKLQIVITRASNHSGPGQKLGFVIPDFCEQIIKADNNGTIQVGNLDALRDIFDVRDCVRAYEIVMNEGQSGEIYNIGTGETISIKEILEKLIQISNKSIQYQIDPARMRPSDIVKNCVNANKIKELGWQPQISLEKTLLDTYDYYRTQI